ncbi:MAG: hypothetical protein NC299_07685 [Lachnospiraceae bacterium]|nr:hypothetical protein [Ruminococcus sp.]MCM1275235.1 hypothetical protein [Lachnospiraceae bacterium]
MNENKLIYGAGFIDDDLVCEAIDYKPRRISLATWAAAAAAVVIVGGAAAVLARNIGGIPVTSGSSEYTTDDINAGSGVFAGTYWTDSQGGEPSDSGLGYATSISTPSSSGDPPNVPTDPFADFLEYTVEFEGFAEENPSTYGPPPTCEEVMNALVPNPDYPEYDVDSFYLVEVVGVYQSDVYAKMKGWNEHDEKATVYRVLLVKDLISNEGLGYEVNLKIPAGRGGSIQTKGDPTYAKGERFVAALTKPCEGYDFVMTVCDYALRYDVPQQAFTEGDEETMLYYRGVGLARQPISDLPFDTEEINIETAYSTPQNPATYVQKIALDDLVELLREEWRQRGISSHFGG